LVYIKRFIPVGLSLAVQELEENHIGKLSFRGKECIEQVSKKQNKFSFSIIFKKQPVLADKTGRHRKFADCIKNTNSSQ
jgi:hypothetical protein